MTQPHPHPRPAPREYIDLCRFADQHGHHVGLTAHPEHRDMGGRIIAPGALNLLTVTTPQGTRLADATIHASDLAGAAAHVNRKLKTAR